MQSVKRIDEVMVHLEEVKGILTKIDVTDEDLGKAVEKLNVVISKASIAATDLILSTPSLHKEKANQKKVECFRKGAQIQRLLEEGLTNAQIAQRLQMTTSGVSQWKKQIENFRTDQDYLNFLNR